MLGVVPSRRRPSALFWGPNSPHFRERDCMLSSMMEGLYRLELLVMTTTSPSRAPLKRPVCARSLADLTHTPYPQNSGRWVSDLATLGRALEHTQGQARTCPPGLMMAGWASAERAFVCSSFWVSKLRTALSCRPQQPTLGVQSNNTLTCLCQSATSSTHKCAIITRTTSWDTKDGRTPLKTN